MKIATILPTQHLRIEDASDYHLCLAHHLCQDLTYAFFFREQVRRGAFVMLDNGAAENGVPMVIRHILYLSEILECQEIVLPDTIGDKNKTLADSYAAFSEVEESAQKGIRVMAVPQGRTPQEWKTCVMEMVSWEVDTIGISKFIAPALFPSRLQALLELPELLEAKCDIHLLGYTGIEGEIGCIESLLPNRIRGVDSSIATLYTQIGQLLEDKGRPEISLDLTVGLDEKLLNLNIRRWKDLCSI